MYVIHCGLDGNLIVYYIHLTVGKSTTQLNERFENFNWSKSIQNAMDYPQRPFQVLNMNPASAKIEAAVQERLEVKQEPW